MDGYRQDGHSPYGAVQVRGLRCRGDDGFAGGFEGLLFGMLLFVAGTLLVANAWGVVDTKTAAEDAARQAVRTYVEAPTAATALAGAVQAADETLAGYGRSSGESQVKVTAGGGFARCERVTIVVSYPAPLFDLPFIGRVGRAETVTAQHSELVDPYRTGLPGTAACP